MELTGSTGSSYVKEKKPRIKKGYYKGVLKEFKAFQDKDGKDIEAKFGKQALMLFEVYEGENRVFVGDKPLILAKLTYSHWKNKDGTYSSALTKGSNTTKILKALGWEFAPGKSLNTEELVGRACELNIDDYEAKWIDEKGVESTYKASTIKDINPLEENEGGSASSSSISLQTPAPKKNEDLLEEIKRIDETIIKLQKAKDDGFLTEEGLNLALQSLRMEQEKKGL